MESIEGMRILFVHPAAEISVSDVSRGYRSALERTGHEIEDYWMNMRFKYHQKSIPTKNANDANILSRMSSETILNEAIYHDADLVLIISGLNVHPIALWLLGKIGIPAAVILTESPYDDEYQKQWLDVTPTGAGEENRRVNLDMTVFTNDRSSALKYGWNFLPPSFDPAVHHPVDPNPDDECDVVFVGTGWPERQAFLEAVDWTGIDVRIYGVWPQMTPESPIHRFYRPMIVNNMRAPELYCSAKVNININRKSDEALTPGPRVYEIAACGGFLLTDYREDISTMFGDSIPTFDSPKDLENKIKFYLAHPEERKFLAAKALDAVCDQDFDRRAESLISAFLGRKRSAKEAVTADSA